MKTTMYLILTIALTIGCTKQNSSTIWDVGIDLLVVDTKGTDLLSPSNSGYIDVKKARVTYILDNKEIAVHEPKLDCPTHFCLKSEGNRNSVAFLPNNTEKEEFPITLIYWPDNVIDTVKCHFIRLNGNVICDKVWYNNVLKYPNEAVSGYQRAFKIIK